jgi:hypothetical protein
MSAEEDVSGVYKALSQCILILTEKTSEIKGLKDE